MKQLVSPPSVFLYQDYRLYLGDWEKWAQAHHLRKFSHRFFMRKAGSKNPGLLRNVINGDENISLQGLPGFLKALELEGADAQWFEMMVTLKRAQDRADAQMVMLILDHMARFRRVHEAGQLKGASFRLLAEWHLVALRELVAFPGFQEDPAWIAQQFRSALSETEIQDALKALEELGLVRRENGRLVQNAGNLRTDDVAESQAATLYHLAMSEQARETLVAIRTDAQLYARTRFLGLTLSISEDRIPLLIEELHKVQQNLWHIGEPPGTALKPEVLYQINLQIFPLTR